VAFRGLRQDGHAFIDEAVSRGAVAVLCERRLSRPDIPWAQVRNGRQALSAVSASFYRHPSRRLQVIGVTGTNGKTTTTFMLSSLLERKGAKTGIMGTLCQKIDGEYAPSSITTPDAPDIHGALATMVERGVTHVCMEVSSHALELARVDHVRFDAAALTNMSPDHYDFHGSWRDYVRAKARLFEILGPDAVAVVNVDDANWRQVAGRTSARLIRAGLRNADVDVLADKVETSGGASFELALLRPLPKRGGGAVGPLRVPIRLRIPGAHNVYNALLAGTLALLYGVPAKEVQRGLAAFKGVRRRMEVVYDGEFRVIDDFAHNPASFEAVLEAIAEQNPARLIIVVAIRGNRGPEINAVNARALAKWASCIPASEVIVTSSSDAVGAKDRVTLAEKESFLAGLERAGVPYEFHPRLTTAISRAIDLARRHDTVLLLGAQGMDRAEACLRDALRGPMRQGCRRQHQPQL